MITRLLLASILFLSFIDPGIRSQTIQWNANRKLSWSDFKKTPPAGSTNAALTSSGILMSFSTNGKSFSYELSCNFDQNSSWGRVKNDHILAHEQGHFDIAEIYTRKLNRGLKAYRYKPASFNKDVNEIYSNTMRALEQAQSDYDRQTDHSRDFTQQKIWLLKIKTSLQESAAFADYK